MYRTNLHLIGIRSTLPANFQSIEYIGMIKVMTDQEWVVESGEQVLGVTSVHRLVEISMKCNGPVYCLLTTDDVQFSCNLTSVVTYIVCFKRNKGLQ